MNPSYETVANRADHRCEYCRAPEIIFNFPFEVDHVIPRSKLAADEVQNLALSCHACNLFKSDFEAAQDPETSVRVRLFDPRRDRWTDHFEVDTQTAKINGKTAIGRAAVERLRMNRPKQIESRKRWMLLDLFP